VVSTTLSTISSIFIRNSIYFFGVRVDRSSQNTKWQSHQKLTMEFYVKLDASDAVWKPLILIKYDEADFI
jgi:hypothetical protein